MMEIGKETFVSLADLMYGLVIFYLYSRQADMDYLMVTTYYPRNASFQSLVTVLLTDFGDKRDAGTNQPWQGG